LGGKRRKKHSFALAEVCIAIIIIGICSTYVFSTLQQTIDRYIRLRHEIRCHELADEHLARLIGSYLTDPPDFETAVGETKGEAMVGIYKIHIATQAIAFSEEAKNTTETTAKKKGYLVTLVVTVNPADNLCIYAIRSTELCITQEGT
jgi:type II secretory pathway pseudopilin PulG